MSFHKIITISVCVGSLLILGFILGNKASLASLRGQHVEEDAKPKGFHNTYPWIHSKLEDCFSTSAFIYRSQYKRRMEAAKQMWVHWWFTMLPELEDLDSVDTDKSSAHREMVTKRLQAWGKLLKKWGREDFKLEKDKRQMYLFFKRNGIPHSPVLEDWSNAESLVHALTDGSAFRKVEVWPVFLKVTHMHGGAAGGNFVGVKRIKTPEKVDTKELVDWANRMFAKKADDVGRVWREAGNLLTDTVDPGVILQSAAFDLSDGSKIEEFRVEVVWGHAFVSSLAGICHFVRGSSPGEVEAYRIDGLASILFFHKWMPHFILHNEFCSNHWSVAEGHWKCIFHVAEKVAKAAAIDFVRVDIFAHSGHPDDCQVNEVSTSSNFEMFSFKRYVAKLWIEPHKEKWYKQLGNSSFKPVYKLGPGDVPHEGHEVETELHMLHMNAFMLDLYFIYFLMLLLVGALVMCIVRCVVACLVVLCADKSEEEKSS